VFACVGSLSAEEGKCPNDGAMREVVTAHSFSGRESYGSRTVTDVGLPLHDVFVARSAETEIQILINGDRSEVFHWLSDK
jgi:hypothetical protein